MRKTKTLDDLNNLLFQQLETLMNEDLTDEQLDKEIKRTEIVNDSALVIINAKKLHFDAKKTAFEMGFEIDFIKENIDKRVLPITG